MQQLTHAMEKDGIMSTANREFAADFCPGVNVLIGENGSGKTTLLKCIYDLKWSYVHLITENGDTIVTELLLRVVWILNMETGSTCY